MTNTPSDIPDGSGIDTADTDLDLPDLPGAWEWRTANHTASFNGKVNVFFGRDTNTPGGWMGEIDNYQHDGAVLWDVHVREIIDLGDGDCRPASGATTCEAFESLDAAIASVPEHIRTHYVDGETEVQDQ